MPTSSSARWPIADSAWFCEGASPTGCAASTSRRPRPTAGRSRDYLAVGEIYCKMLVCCELALDVRRAEQWMAVAAGYDRDHNAPWMSAICRMHYGGILIAAGRWGEAEHELSTAVRALRHGLSGAPRRRGRPSGRPAGAAGPVRGGGTTADRPRARLVCGASAGPPSPGRRRDRGRGRDLAPVPRRRRRGCPAGPRARAARRGRARRWATRPGPRAPVHVAGVVGRDPAVARAGIRRLRSRRRGLGDR